MYGAQLEVCDVNMIPYDMQQFIAPSKTDKPLT